MSKNKNKNMSSFNNIGFDYFNKNNLNNHSHMHKPRLTELSLTNKVKLIISKEIQSQIMNLHAFVGNVEWSGPLFYTIVSGDINSPSEFILKAEFVFPCDVGTSGYTEYEFGPEMIDFYDKYPHISGMKMGHIHTHHSMNTFFSGTDTQELHDNAPSHNYYLSLIVNHESKFCAKVAFVAERSIKKAFDEDILVFKGSNGSEDKIELQPDSTKESKQKVLVILDCDIEFEQDKFFIDRITELKNKPRHTNISYHSQDNLHSGTYQDRMNKLDNFVQNNKSGEQTKLSFENWVEKNNKDDKEQQNIKISSLSRLQLESFLCKWIGCDVLNEDGLFATLLRINNKTKGKGVDTYINTLDDNFIKFAEDILCINPLYLEDQHSLAEVCISLLKSSAFEGYKIVEDIIGVLDTYTDKDFNTFKNYTEREWQYMGI